MGSCGRTATAQVNWRTSPFSPSLSPSASFQFQVLLLLSDPFFLPFSSNASRILCLFCRVSTARPTLRYVLLCRSTSRNRTRLVILITLQFHVLARLPRLASLPPTKTHASDSQQTRLLILDAAPGRTWTFHSTQLSNTQLRIAPKATQPIPHPSRADTNWSSRAAISSPSPRRSQNFSPDRRGLRLDLEA